MTVEIPLSRGLVALVDDADAEWLGRWKWYATPHHSGGFYAATKDPGYLGKPGKRFMHHAILPTPPGLFVDHRDLNKLNNTRANLRLCTRAENCRNRGVSRNSTTGIKGVYLDRGRYRAAIKKDGRRLYLGTFEKIDDAAAAYASAAAEMHGQFARTA